MCSFKKVQAVQIVKEKIQIKMQVYTCAYTAFSTTDNFILLDQIYFDSLFFFFLFFNLWCLAICRNFIQQHIFVSSNLILCIWWHGCTIYLGQPSLTNIIFIQQCHCSCGSWMLNSQFTKSLSNFIIYIQLWNELCT